jgi:cell division protein ZapA
MSKPAMQQVDVVIMGQSYRLSCPEGHETPLSQAVARVDQEMTTIRESGKLRVRERIAVLAALNIVFEQLVNGSGNDLPGSSTPATAASSSAADAAKIDQLIARMDSALSGDGMLL